MKAFDALLHSLPVSPLRLQVYNARKVFFQRKKSPVPALMAALETQNTNAAVEQFLVAVQSWNAFIAISKGETNYEHVLNLEYRQLFQALQQEDFQRALLFASHDLLEAAIKMKEFPEKPGKKERRFLLAAYRYLTRGALKTSPFSRFTTVGLQDLRRASESPEWFHNRPVVTPNVALLPAFYEFLLSQPVFYRNLRVRLNPSFRKLERGVLEWLYFDGEQESFQSMPAQAAVELVLEMLEEQPESVFMELLLHLQEKVDAHADQLEKFLLELTEFGLLSWQLPEPGNSAGWVSNLIQYLTRLSGADSFSEWIFALQHIRTTARTLPFKPVNEALNDLQTLKRSVDSLFEKNGHRSPDIPASRFFFEDVESLPVNIPVDKSDLLTWTGDLKTALHDFGECQLPEFKSGIAELVEELLNPDQAIPFLEFCRKFFEHKRTAEPRNGRLDCPIIGALMMPFEENGEKKAVVNALFPGGGKLFSRWSHLFPDHFKKELKDWQDEKTIFFPWQGWSNVNFQPFPGGTRLEVPDGRFNAGSGKRLLLSELFVKRTSAGVVLTDGQGNRIIFTDLGLEAPELRPPAMQLLWRLGVPYISTALFHSRIKRVGKNGIVFSERLEYQSIVLARAAWQISPEAFQPLLTERSNASFYSAIRKQFNPWGIPRRVFVKPQIAREKPQFLDMDSPLSVLHLEKMMRQQSNAALLIEEMLPLPNQWIAGASSKIPVEIAVEFKPGNE